MAITYSVTKEGEIINDHHLIAQVLGEALPYINFLKGKTLVIKLGGKCAGAPKNRPARYRLVAGVGCKPCAGTWWWPLHQ